MKDYSKNSYHLSLNINDQKGKKLFDTILNKSISVDLTLNGYQISSQDIIIQDLFFSAPFVLIVFTFPVDAKVTKVEEIVTEIKEDKTITDTGESYSERIEKFTKPIEAPKTKEK